MDALAKGAGLLIAIPDELYMSDLTKNSAIFVEVEGGVCKCYKLTWAQEEDGVRKIQHQKDYITGTSSVAFKKAKDIINWHAQRREVYENKKEAEFKKKYTNWKKRKEGKSIDDP